MFIEAIRKFSPNYAALSSSSEHVCSVKSSAGLNIDFFPTYVVLSKEQTSLKLDYDEFAAIAVKKSGTKITAVLNDKKISYDTSDGEKANGEAEFLKSLCMEFKDGSESSPYENLRVLCEESGIFFDGKYNKYLYHLVFENNALFNTILENGVLPENCSIEFILEEHTASFFDNASGTVTNLASSFFSGNLVSSLFNAGKKIVKSVGNELIGNSGILVVTNKNVIFAKGSSVEIIADEMSDAIDALDHQRDQTIHGAADIYYNGDKILDNVSEKLWSEYKNVIRKLKNHPKDNYIEDSSNSDDAALDDFENDSESNYDIVEEKLLKMKKLLDSGLISQNDYDKKKNEILGVSDSGENTDKKEAEETVPAVKAPPLVKKQVENKSKVAEKRNKKHGCLFYFLLIMGIIWGLFTLLVIIAGFAAD
ncbi:MAG: hypothetical protein SOT81_06945 [Treponema sp.]|nr:hypothetical protein [Treponema sp.]